MDESRVPSSLNRLSVQLTRGQLKTRQEAKEQEAVIHARLRQAGLPIPPFEFQNYIGKGSYGRVYVAKDMRPGGRGRVAIKVLDIDSVDFGANLKNRDQSFEDFLQELKTLQQLQSYGARNVNQIYEVMEVHSQFWIISEYCPGGSVHTLMQATSNKVDEKYLIPIARELALGLNAVHQAFVIHRDVKAANVMVHEEGAIQIIDFGVAGMIQNQGDKRKTMIGTPHWMGPEALNPGEEGYGKEVDTWAFGCTLIEMATGAPPRKQVAPQQLERAIRLQGAPRLKPEQGHSQGLCDLVAFVLVKDPKQRPSMEQILDHPYLKGTENAYPTSSLRHFVGEFEDWARAGGQRVSLYAPFGAAAARLPDDIISKPEWRFSTIETTEIMEGINPTIDEALADAYHNQDHTNTSHLDPVADMSSTKAQEDTFNSYVASEPSSPFLSDSEMTPNASPTSQQHPATSNEAATASAADEKRVGHGEKKLGRLFDPHLSQYNYPGLNTQQSDLPLRNSTPDSTATNSKQKEVEANITGTSNSGNIALADPATLKAKRKDRNTMNWTWPGEPMTEASDDSQEGNSHPSKTVPEVPKIGIDKAQASVPSNAIDPASHAGDFEDLGAPDDEAYEDTRVPQYTTPSNTARQTLDLDVFGASLDINADNDEAKTMRQTLDLDALMSGMDLGSANSSSFEAPHSAEGNEPNYNYNYNYKTTVDQSNEEGTDTDYEDPLPRTPANEATMNRELKYEDLPVPYPPSQAVMDGSATSDERYSEVMRMINGIEAHMAFAKRNCDRWIEEIEAEEAAEAAANADAARGNRSS
ncbi:hypothetical protein ACLMJK_006718 [Lecanora helva]